MIALTKSADPSTVARWQQQFLKLLTRIERQARFHFRHLRAEAHEDAVREVIANAFCAFWRLVALNRPDRVYASALVRFAVAQYHAGRRVGCSHNSRDVYSTAAHYRRGTRRESLSGKNLRRASWMEWLADNSSTPVPDQAAFRIDFPEWLLRLSVRDRRIAQSLAHGHSTSEVARRYRISAGRVSQLRRKLHDSWGRFQGEAELQSACQR